MFKKIIFTLTGIFLSSLFTLIVIDLILFFFPVNQGMRALSVNKQNPVFRFEPNRTSQYSKNWNFDIKNIVKTNNDGFVNDFDYDEESKEELLSIIGDSYVEALMVPFKNSLSGRLQSSASHRRVYSFAASGAGLSQHMIWAKYVKDKYKSDYFVFVIISNDFAESLAKYEKSPGFHRFKKSKDTRWNLELANYEPSTIRKVFRESRLAMYLLTNIKVHNLLNFQLQFGVNDERKNYVSNFQADYNEEFWKDAKWATEIYLNNLYKYSGVKPEKIIFVIDGIRQNIYDKNDKAYLDSFWYNIRQYFMKEAKLKGYHVLDMHEEFKKSYRDKKKKFEFKTDSHWNVFGHKTVADSITNTDLWKNFIK